MSYSPALSLFAGLLLLGAAPPPDASPGSAERAADEAAVKAAGVGVDGPSLLACLHKRTLTRERRVRAAPLVAQLGNDSFAMREKASEALLELGPAVLPLLRPLGRSSDLEQRRRARRLIEQLERGLDPGLIPAVARLLAVRKPPGATAALLAYLPDAINVSEADEVRAALTAVSCPGGKPDRVIVAALTDPDPVRRAAAAEAVGKSGSKEHAAAVRKLLTDREAGVRMRAALALTAAREKPAVAVLIDLTAELPSDQRWQVEDALFRIAGAEAPAPPGDDTPEGGKKRRALWADWWNRNRDKADLGRLGSDVSRGYTLCVVFAPDGDVHVSELGRDGKPMWTIKKLSNAGDARILPGNRVLIAELGAARVTERTFDGRIVWEQKCAGPGKGLLAGPFQAQRLANGNTFLTTMSGVVEMDRTGKQVHARTIPGGLRAAHKYRDGRIALVSGNDYIRLDAAGKEEKKYRINLKIANAIGGVDFLPDGGLLVVRADRVVQYDANGKEVWQAVGLRNPYCPTRLSNGHTLAACTGTKQFIEFDRAGKVVRKFPVAGTPWVARRR